MASDRTINTRGNYDVEQWTYNRQLGYATQPEYGVPRQTNLPGNGLLAGNVSRTQLSNNSCDIESMLFGIGSTNLVTPQQPTQPEIKYLQSLNVHEKIPLLIPSALKIEPNQRPLLQ
jgi:hypothetical protein